MPTVTSPDAASNAFVWIHCHIQSPALERLLAAGAIDRVAFDLLSAAETRPRCVLHDDAVMLNLRGRAIEEIPGESDLGAIRFWLVDGGVISTWRRPTLAVSELLSAIDRGFCPNSLGDFMARLSLWIVDTIEPMVDELSETIDDLELAAVNGSEILQRREMSEVRRDAIDLRRFLYPQRDAFSTFLIEHIGRSSTRPIAPNYMTRTNAWCASSTSWKSPASAAASCMTRSSTTARSR